MSGTACETQSCYIQFESARKSHSARDLLMRSFEGIKLECNVEETSAWLYLILTAREEQVRDVPQQ